MKKQYLSTVALLAAFATGATAHGAPGIGSATFLPIIAPQADRATVIDPENVDGSKVNKATQNAAAKIIGDYEKANKAGEQGALSTAIAALEIVHTSDPLNLAVITWLGYGYIQSNQAGKAVSILESATEKSKDPAVNTTNARNLGAAYYSLGKYAQAIDALNLVLKHQPNDAATLAVIGSAQLMEGKSSEAIETLRQAKSLGASGSKIDVDLGVAYYKAGRTEEALKIFEAIEKSGQVDESVLSWMGYSYLQASRYDDAIRVLELAHGKNSGDPQVTNNLASSYLKRDKAGDRAKALVLFKSLASINPQLSWYNVGTIYLMESDFASAKEALSKSLEAGKDAGAYNNLGRACEGLNESHEAAVAYGAASDFDPTNQIYARNAGVTFYKSGERESAKKYLVRAKSLGAIDIATTISLSDLGSPAEGLAMLENIKADSATNPDFWFNYGMLKSKTGDKSGAEAAYGECLKLRNDMAAHTNLGVLQFERGAFAEAESNFKVVADSAGAKADDKLNYAASLLKVGKMAEAIPIWRAVLKADSSLTEVRLNLADALWTQNDSSGARFHYSTVLKTDSNNPRALNGMGLWYMLESQNVNAEKAFRAAIAARQNYRDAYYNLAVTLERENKVGQAKDILKKAVKLFPDYEEARKALARLESRK